MKLFFLYIFSLLIDLSCNVLLIEKSCSILNGNRKIVVTLENGFIDEDYQFIVHGNIFSMIKYDKTNILSEVYPSIYISWRELSCYNDMIVIMGSLMREEYSLGTVRRAISFKDSLISINMEYSTDPFTVHSLSDLYHYNIGKYDTIYSSNIKVNTKNIFNTFSLKNPFLLVQSSTNTIALVLDTIWAGSIYSLPIALDSNYDLSLLSFNIVETIRDSSPDHSLFSINPHSQIKLPFFSKYYLYYDGNTVFQSGFQSLLEILWNANFHLPYDHIHQYNRYLPLKSIDSYRKYGWESFNLESSYTTFSCELINESLSFENCAGFRTYKDYLPLIQDIHYQISYFYNDNTLRTALGYYLYLNRTGQDITPALSLLNSFIYLSCYNKLIPGIIYLAGEEEKFQMVHDSYINGLCNEYPHKSYPYPSCMMFFHSTHVASGGLWLIKWIDVAKSFISSSKLDMIYDSLDKFSIFFLNHQNSSSGLFPVYYDPDTLSPMPELAYSNIESAHVALFLLKYYQSTNNTIFFNASVKAIQGIYENIFLHRKLSEYESFLSNSRCSFDYYDNITKQYPNSNMGLISFTHSYYYLYIITKNIDFLIQGIEVLEYLLLSQSSWSHPSLSVFTVGGFTGPNLDSMWIDARGAYIVDVLFDYYFILNDVMTLNTSDSDKLASFITWKRIDGYLSRASKAIHALLSIVPYENFARTGEDIPGDYSSFNWGFGSTLSTIEFAYFYYNIPDIFINAITEVGICFEGCSISRVKIEGNHIKIFLLTDLTLPRSFILRINNLCSKYSMYSVFINDEYSGSFDLNSLESNVEIIILADYTPSRLMEYIVLFASISIILILFLFILYRYCQRKPFSRSHPGYYSSLEDTSLDDGLLLSRK